MFEDSFQTTTFTRYGTRAGVVQGGLDSTILFSLYGNDIAAPCHHVDLALYADDTDIIAEGLLC
jgi:hypothetical protein